MKDYRPPFTITNEILAYVSSISEKVGRITATVHMEAKPHLRKNNRIKSVHASLRIEANPLSLGQVRDVINGKTVLGEQLSEYVKRLMDVFELESIKVLNRLEHTEALGAFGTEACVIKEC